MPKVPKAGKYKKEVVVRKDFLAPASIPQEQFLASESKITLYSGSAGAGKTFAAVLLIIKYLQRQNSNIIVFRRVSDELRGPGGIWKEAVEAISKLFGKRVRVRDREMELIFTEYNSICKFSHLQYASDVEKHKSLQYSIIIFDEATTFDPFDDFIIALLFRLRNCGADYSPKMFLCTNPKYGHGLYHWLKDFYLGPDGVPLAEKSNVERYFVRQGNALLWYDDLAEAQSIHGVGPLSGIMSFRSIRAHLTDNKPLMEKNPEYITTLMALPDVQRKVYLDGSWTARLEEEGLYKREWSKKVFCPPTDVRNRVRVWDLASMPVSNQTPNPDWTRGTLVSRTHKGVYTIEDLKSIRDRPYVVQQLVLDTAESDGRGVTVVYPLDPGGGEERAYNMKRLLAERGYNCLLMRPKKSKRERFLPFSAIAQAGFVQVIEANWNEDFFAELEEFSGLKRHERDDIVDTCSDAISALNKVQDIPQMALGSFASTPNFGFQSVGIPASSLTFSL